MALEADAAAHRRAGVEIALVGPHGPSGEGPLGGRAAETHTLHGSEISLLVSGLGPHLSLWSGGVIWHT